MNRQYTALMAVILLLLAAGCKKDNDQQKRLIGTWELRHTGGSWIRNDYQPGNGNLLKFTRDRYEIHKDGAIIRSGTYGTNEKGTSTGGDCSAAAPAKPGNIIIFANNPHEEKHYYEINDNQLETRYGCFELDGGVLRRYEKIAN